MTNCGIRFDVIFPIRFNPPTSPSTMLYAKAGLSNSFEFSGQGTPDRFPFLLPYHTSYLAFRAEYLVRSIKWLGPRDSFKHDPSGTLAQRQSVLLPMPRVRIA